MFQACYSLENLDLSQWNTASVKNTMSMFFDCKKLSELNVGSWNVSKATNFNQLFVRCASLTNIYGLGNWVTTNGTAFGNLFHGCTSLVELDLSGFDTAKAADMQGFFTGLSSLQKLTLGEKFSCDANGKLGGGTKTAIPTPVVAGSDGKWYNATTGEAFAPKDIPQGAATYVAVNPNP